MEDQEEHIDFIVQLRRARNCIGNRYCERYKCALETGLRKAAGELKRKDDDRSVNKVDIILIIDRIQSATICAIPVDFEEDLCEEACIYALNKSEDEMQFEQPYAFDFECSLHLSMLQPQFYGAAKQIVQAVFLKYYQAIDECITEEAIDTENVKAIETSIKQLVSKVLQICGSLTLNTIKLLQQVKVVKNETFASERNFDYIKMRSKTNATEGSITQSAVTDTSSSPITSCLLRTTSLESSSQTMSSYISNYTIKRGRNGTKNGKQICEIDLTEGEDGNPPDSSKRQKPSSSVSSSLSIDLTVDKEERCVQTDNQSEASDEIAKNSPSEGTDCKEGYIGQKSNGQSPGPHTEGTKGASNFRTVSNQAASSSSTSETSQASSGSQASSESQPASDNQTDDHLTPNRQVCVGATLQSCGRVVQACNDRLE